MDFTISAIKEKPIRSLLENSLEIIGICGSDGTIQYASPSVTRIAGYAESEPVGRNFSEFVHSEDLPSMLEAFRTAQEKDGVSKEATCRYRHKNGAWYWAECVWTSYLLDPKIGAVVINVRDVTDKKSIDTELNRSRIELRALAKRNQTLIEDESKRLSIEIHDRMGQSLTALKLAVISLEQALKKEYGADCIRKLRKTLEEMNKSINEAMSTARSVSLDLRPRTLDQLGLVAALEEESRAFENRTSIACKLSLPENEPAVDPEKATAVYRIFKEALTNVVRHASASEISVDLSFADGNLRLVVSDNGTGRLPRLKGAFSGLGLIGMQERALIAGLQANVTGTPSGTRVVVEGPF